ncbi:MAG: dihydropteroate synthase, partial [Chloroflexi bacterium]|nr:dihydropteroate synthase [Chloroflexota bacterium]
PAGAPAVDDGVAKAQRMVGEGADILDIGGESTRPGHVAVSVDAELARVVPVIRAIRAALPDVPLSVDSRKVAVALAALDAGADVLNDVSGVTSDGSLAAVAGARGVPYVVMHDRGLGEAAIGTVAALVVDDLSAAIERAVSLGCQRRSIIVDPGVGFGKTPGQNLELLRDLDALRVLGHPVLLGASRKSTIGLVLGLPPDDRLEGTLATTALGIAAGADLVRVHDVQANQRLARMSDAIVRGWQPADQGR